MAAENQQKHLRFTFSIKLFLFTWELAYVHTNTSSNTWNSYTVENQEERLVFNETAFLFWCHALWKLGSSNCCIFEVKDATGMETCTKMFFVYLQPSVNKNSQNLAVLTLQFDDVTVKIIYTKNHSLLNLLFSRHKRGTRSRPGATLLTSVTSRTSAA